MMFLMSSILFMLSMVTFVLPKWGADAMSSATSKVPWSIGTVILTWLSMYIFNHFHGWWELIPEAAKDMKCPPRKKSNSMYEWPSWASVESEVNRIQSDDRNKHVKEYPVAPAQNTNQSRRTTSGTVRVVTLDEFQHLQHQVLRHEGRLSALENHHHCDHCGEITEELQTHRHPKREKNDDKSRHTAKEPKTPPMKIEDIPSTWKQIPEGYFAVRGGPNPGVYDTSEDAKRNSKGRKGAHAEWFANYDDALNYSRSGPTKE